ncbi:CHAT domain-containing protein [Longimicrobium sp.]|uniref:CHAT domain-containing protein n=1 Tax=Longimicrobium sp. TaxID=2029185 RepID=UPI002BBF73E8|nr:CHAT domain-containing protein [Longimicrobium sp.]HSU17992.1 CHAT domain-containing protein [Longimicrobium sp.]
MSIDPADAAAKALIAYWQREEMDAPQRLLCSRLEKTLDADTRATLSDAARADAEGSVPRVAEALRDAAAADWMAGNILRAFPPASAGVQVHVVGNGNQTTVAGRDVIIGGGHRARDADAPPPDNILVAGADPRDLVALRVGQEAREISEAIQLGRLRDRWAVHLWLSVRLPDLTRGLLEQTPRILHFSGHGNEDEGLFLEDEGGYARPMSGERLRGLFRRLPFKVECVVLNSCYSEPQACAIAQHVPYVIGTAGELPDESAIKFSRGFYQALAAGCSVPQAYEMGCVHWEDAEMAEYPLPRLISRDHPCATP